MDVDIGVGVLCLVWDFILMVMWDWFGNQGGDVCICQGDWCEVCIDGELVLIGYVFGILVWYDVKLIFFFIKGCLFMVDLVDCCLDDKFGQWCN